MSNMEAKLTTILGMVNDWLKYAETKNFGLIAFCGVVIAAIISFLSSVSKISSTTVGGLLLAMGLLSLSSLLSLITFLPRVNLPKMLTIRRYPPQSTDNLHFFGHLCKYSPEQLADTIANLYFQDANYAAHRERIATDIAAQIVANATITMNKLLFFSISLCITIIAVIIVPILFLIHFAFPPI